MKRKKNLEKNSLQFHVIFGRISAEISAEVSVNLAEISVSAETDFGRFGRSLFFSLKFLVNFSHEIERACQKTQEYHKIQNFWYP